MSIFNYTQFTDGQYPTATDFNNNWDAIKSLINGKLDRDNIDTKWSQFAISLRVDDADRTASYDIYQHFPNRLTGPVNVELIGYSYDAFLSGTETATIKILDGVGTTQSTLTLPATHSEGYVKALVAYDSANKLTVRVTQPATSGFTSGDYVFLTLFFGSQLMTDTELEG